ncbi:cytochrome P450 2F3 [Parasteatoda tepidariorum]|uniref:cytochrome P450 2F3 n=1 Tax=Parasteatoda tepidariorum TaxID=114398 RepID=UPI001C71D777|nr:cytochrome P450 2F3 isoform X1 [Parasteatoda tepidariorum]
MKKKIKNCIISLNKKMFQEFLKSVCGETTAAIIVIVVVTVCIYYYKRNKGLPPGPVSFPFFGYSLILKDDTCHRTLERLQKKYGDVFSFTFAGTLYINMGSMKAVQEFHLTHAECFQRSNDFSIISYFFNSGVSVANGEPWKVMRKFALQQLREYGMTTVKDNMSEPLYDSIQETIGFLKAKKGESVEMVQHLTNKCNAILRSTMFGQSGITEEQVKEINEAYAHIVAFMSITNFFYNGFLTRFIFPLKPGYWTAMKNYKIIKRTLESVVNEHKSMFNKDEHPKNFIDAYLKERNDRHCKGDPTAKYFTDKALVGTLIQFVSDGVLSVALFIAIFMKHVVDHQDHQDKIYAEIVEVVGRGRAPTIEDKSKLPYTTAYMHEILRTFEIFSVVPGQQCTKETVIRGYRIPKGAMTLVNMWTCHNDPEIYPEPEKFNPSRFMCEDKSKRPDLPINFGVGRRSCIGEGYTMSQIFLFLTTIIQNFKLTYPEGSEIGNYEFLLSGKLDICAIPRNEEK